MCLNPWQHKNYTSTGLLRALHWALSTDWYLCTYIDREDINMLHEMQGKWKTRRPFTFFPIINHWGNCLCVSATYNMLTTSGSNKRTEEQGMARIIFQKVGLDFCFPTLQQWSIFFGGSSNLVMIVAKKRSRALYFYREKVWSRRVLRYRHASIGWIA